MILLFAAALATAADCTSITDAAARLSCYDEQAKSAPPPPAPPVEHGAWQLVEQTNAMDDSVVHAATLVSSDGKTAMLIARCMRGRVEVLVMWNAYMGEAGAVTRVGWRLDKQPPESDNWAIGTDHVSLFARNSLTMLGRLMLANQLVVEVTPYGDPAAQAIFDLTGASVALAGIQSCHK